MLGTDEKFLALVILAMVIFSVSPAGASIFLQVADTGGIVLTDNPSDSSYELVVEGRGGTNVPEPGEVQSAVQVASNRHRMPESLVYSVIRGWEPVRGGLMALPAPVRSSFTDTQIKNPLTNVDTGTYRLRKMLGRYEGNLTLALAAYRLGPEPVDEAGGIPRGDDSTRQFVSDVRSAFEEFEQRSEVILTFEDETGTLTVINIE